MGNIISKSSSSNGGPRLGGSADLRDPSPPRVSHSPLILSGSSARSIPLPISSPLETTDLSLTSTVPPSPAPPLVPSHPTPWLFTSIENPAIKTLEDNRLRPDAVTHTEQLARALAFLTEEELLYADLERLALTILEIFQKTELKTAEQVEEVSLLAFSQHPTIVRALLQSLLDSFRHSTLLHTAALRGLLFVFSHARPLHWLPDDLLQTARTLIDRLQNIHIQLHQEGPVYEVLRVLRAVFSVMALLNEQGTSHVFDVSRQEWEETFYRQLEGLRPRLSPFLVVQLEYTQQSVMRIAHNETAWSAVLRRTLLLTQGLGYVIRAVQADPDAVQRAYTIFCSLSRTTPQLAPWYEPLQCLTLLVEANSFITFERTLRESVTAYHQEVHFVIGVLQLCEDIVREHRHMAVQKTTIQLVTEIVQNPQKWGQESPIIRAYGSALLQAWSMHPLKELAQAAQQCISTFGTELWPTPSLLTCPILPLHAPSSTTLLEEAQSQMRSLIGNLERALEQVKEKVLADKVLSEQLNVYIPIMIKSHTSGSSVQDAETEIIHDFLNASSTSRSERVCLIQGDSGSGKSMFLFYLYKTLWGMRHRDAPVPLFIHLPSIEKPQTQLIEKALHALELDTKQIAQLKSTRRFIFLLDAYDEMQNPLEKGNLYHSNGLQNWKCHVLITCRSGLLPEEYGRLFSPFTHDEPQLQLLRDRVVVPFSDRQRDAYIDKYLQVHSDFLLEQVQFGYRLAKWNRADTYRASIHTIPGLSELVRNPFLLRIVMETLPDIEKKRHSDARLTPKDLYEAFAHQWFIRQENKLIASNQYVGEDMYDYYRDFAQSLAIEMTRHRMTQVEYKEPKHSRFQLRTTSSPPPWPARFFSKTLQMTIDLTDGTERRETEAECRMRILARRGCPLKKVGPGKYEFFHSALRDYFAAEGMVERTPAATENTQNNVAPPRG